MRCDDRSPRGASGVELTTPREAVEKAGATTHLIAPEAGEVQAFNHLDKSTTFAVDRTVAQVDVDDYDGLVLPGGVANPDELRCDERAVRFVQEIFAAGKPVGVICHGPWTLDPGRGRPRPRPHHHLVAVAAHRYPQRGRQVGRPGGRRRPRARLEPQAR